MKRRRRSAVGKAGGLAASPAGGADAGLLIHQRFEKQAAGTPRRLALVVGEGRLRYGELNCRANRLAHHLRGLGAGPDDLVAICLENAMDSLLVLLAALKAGAAYVPLDPALPAPRLAMMLESLNTPYLATESAWLDRLPEAPRAVCLDRDHAAIDRASDENPCTEVCGGNLVYGLFTSGSTGVPKGVAVAHQQLLNYVDGMLGRLRLPASFATVSNLAADVVNTAIFPTLATGGCLHLVDREQAMNPADLVAYFARHRIDYLKIVPSHLAALLAAPRAAALLPRRGLVIGGEALGWELVDRIQQLDCGLEIINSYGPTEATVAVLTHQVDAAPRLGITVPLGRPLPNTRVDVLDHRLAAATEGELYIAGTSLSRGYLRRPRWTAERFLPDAASREPGGRRYRTGDRVRYLPDGHLEFVGRVDHQVKIRGFRVELGEIEAVLAGHPAVARAVVVVARQGAGDGRLVAYVGASDTDADELAACLRQRAMDHLPPPMLPSAYVVLPALPLTANGKVDRRALPAPPVVGETRAGTAPRTPLETLLAGLWKELLGVDRVDVEASFLELGGHSLLAMQLLARVREACDVEVPVGLFLAAPTLADLSTEVERRRQVGTVLPPITATESAEPAPVSLNQERYWHWRHPQPGTVSRNDLTAFRFEGPLQLRLFRCAVAQVVARHEVLRTSYAERHGRPVQRVHQRLRVALPLVDLARLAPRQREIQVRWLVDAEDARLFDLEHAPLFRLTLFRNSADDHLFLFVIHHIAIDGWSLAVLKRDLIASYEALRQGVASPLAPLAVQYGDFARWQQRHLLGEVWERQMAYWRERLRGVIPSPELPADRPRPAAPSYQGAVERIELSPALTRRLEAVSRQRGVTLFVTLLASFKALVHLHTQEPEISVVSLFANRGRPEIDELIGCFMNVLPLRTRLAGIETFPELLARVQETTLGAHSHPDIPFDRLVREIVLPQLPWKAHELFVFRILFALLGAPELAPESPGLRVSALPVKSDRMYNDLLILLRRVDGRLIGNVKYNTALFDRPRIAALCRQFLQVLEAVAEEEGRRLAALLPAAVSPGDRQ